VLPKKTTLLLTPADGASAWEQMENAFATGSRDLLEAESHQDTGVQHIGLRVAREELLLAVRFVREIIMLPTITFVPRAATAIEGILALRGEIMPVLNLRRLWKLDRGSATSSTRVVILQHEVGGFGIIVDEITDFVSLEENQIEAVPQNFFSQEYSVLEGVAKVGEKVRGVLGFERLLKLLPLAEGDAQEEE
jgi:purine-binding chemotaxis protein CheW